MTVDKLLKSEATRIVKAQCVYASISSASYDVNLVQSHGRRHTEKTGSVGADMSYRIRTTAVLPNGRTFMKCNRPNDFADGCREGRRS
jgi:hypothetical protein